jgi:hypothetical protein
MSAVNIRCNSTIFSLPSTTAARPPSVPRRDHRPDKRTWKYSKISFQRGVGSGEELKVNCLQTNHRNRSTTKNVSYVFVATLSLCASRHKTVLTADQPLDGNTSD